MGRRLERMRFIIQLVFRQVLLLQLVTHPTAAEYKAALKLVISTFNEVNSTVVADLTDPELPNAGANPTVA